MLGPEEPECSRDAHGESANSPSSYSSTQGVDRADPEAALRWLREYQSRLGRKLRILHIGNIANNAFQNARIQRAYGIDADVLCYDYYHIMATPEWEEASFDKAPADAFFPDWHSVDLKGYRRPRWFASGPLIYCCRYLVAHVDITPDANRLWAQLEHARFLVCSRSWQAKLKPQIYRLGKKFLGHINPAVVLRWPRPKFGLRLGSRLATRRRLITIPRSWWARPGKLVHLIKVTLAKGLKQFGDGAAQHRDYEDCATSFEDVQQLWETRRPDRAFPVLPADLKHYMRAVGYFAPLLRRYDIIQGYSTDGIWPLLAGRRYAAYEHGTLRSLPFEDNPTGRLTALCFGLADQVLVTNLDCLASTDRLGIDASRVVPLPHAFNDQKLRDFARAHPEFRPPSPRLRFFTPSRQDWRDADPNLTKGNDRFFRAAAVLAQEGVDFEIVAVRWGRDLAHSEALAAELGLTPRLRWVEPLQKPQLWRHYLESHAVVDQFVLPAFGGVTFEALALGRRVVNALDVPASKRFFGVEPPILVASSVEEISAALRQVAADPSDRAGIGPRSAGWIEQFHSAHRIMILQAAVYRKLLEENAPVTSEHLVEGA